MQPECRVISEFRLYSRKEFCLPKGDNIKRFSGKPRNSFVLNLEARDFSRVRLHYQIKQLIEQLEQEGLI